MSALQPILGVLLVGGSAAAGWLLASQAGLVSPPYLPVPWLLGADWRKRVVASTLAYEGGGRYDAMNLNGDGAGLSVGRIQWSQGGGGLTELLEAWAAADPQRFVSYFGPASAQLRGQVASSSRATRLLPVDGAVLWSEPWVSRFRAALRDTSFQRVQDQLLEHGRYMQGALAAARILGGVPTERGFALLFDRSVQQGPDALASAARAVAADGLGGTFTARAARVADRMARGSAWASDIQRRTTGILRSTQLTDQLLAV